ncbi:AI-2E family transporter, partial [Streptomyces sp. SID4982]|nr:AI-2E family transporter [Streptomyces sp. SID4982]
MRRRGGRVAAGDGRRTGRERSGPAARGAVPGSRPAYTVRLPSVTRSIPRTSVAERTVGWLRIAAAYAWRLILVGIVVWGIFSVLGRFQLIAVSLFLALVVTSVLRPLAD